MCLDLLMLSDVFHSKKICDDPVHILAYVVHLTW